MLTSLLLDAVISFYLFFFVSIPWIIVSSQQSNLASSLPPYFLDSYCLSLSPIGCKVWWIFIKFLVFGAFLLVPPFILKMIQIILQRGLQQCLFLWWDFYSWVWFRAAFSFFSFSPFLPFLSFLFALWCPIPIFPFNFLFPQKFFSFSHHF